MSRLAALLTQHREFLLYCLCGGTGVCVDYALFFALFHHLEVWYQGANAAGYLAGTLVSFMLNRVITFKMRDKTARRLALFLSVAAIGCVFSAGLMRLLVDVAQMDARLAKLLTLPFVVLLQLGLNKRITFKAAA